MTSFDPLGHANHDDDDKAIHILAETWCAGSPGKPVAIEVGCWAGGTTRILAAVGFRVLAVDHWLGNPDPGEPVSLNAQGLPPDQVFGTFCRNMGDRLFRTVFPLCGTSLQWSEVMRESGMQADAIFLDAGHTYDAVREDIQGWLPVLRPGGLLMVHDYQKVFPGVMQAVEELLSPFNVAGFSVAWKEKP